MKNKLLQLAALTGVFCGFSDRVNGFSPTNFSLPHEHYLWNSNRYNYPDHYVKGDGTGFRISVGAYLETGFSPEGRDKDNNKVDAYQIFGLSENIVPSDFTVLSDAAQNQLVRWTNTTVLHDIQDAITSLSKDGALIYSPTSTLKETDLMLNAKIALPFESLPGQSEIVLLLPVKFVDHKVSWAQNTTSGQSQNLIPIGNMAYQPAATLFNLFAANDDINSSDFKVNGIGDVHVLMSWKNHFNHGAIEDLSSIGIFLQSGISFPSAKEANAKDILAFPLGYDKAIGMPMSGAINLNFAKNFRLSAAANAVVFFSETSKRRVATTAEEGNFFLRRNVEVKKDTGALLSFSALGEIISSCKKYSAGLAYHYMKKQEDKFSSNEKGTNFDSAFVSKMEKYKERIAHSLIFQAGINFKDMMESDIAPKVAISLKLPLYNIRTIAYKVLGLEASVSF